MGKWIDADALHDALKAKQKWVVRCGDKHNEGYTYDQVHFAIDDAPSIDIEPKRGEWIDMGDFEQCSVCKGTHLKEFQSYYGKTTWIKTPYCPSCGALMGEREGE